MNTEWEGEGGTNWEGNINMYTVPCTKQITSGKLLGNTDGGPGTLWWPWGMGWDGRGSLQKEGVYNYDWFRLFYGRNKHNTVKQLSSNLKRNLKEVNYEQVLRVKHTQSHEQHCEWTCWALYLRQKLLFFFFFAPFKLPTNSPWYVGVDCSLMRMKLVGDYFLIEKKGTKI